MQNSDDMIHDDDNADDRAGLITSSKKKNKKKKKREAETPNNPSSSITNTDLAASLYGTTAANRAQRVYRNPLLNTPETKAAELYAQCQRDQLSNQETLDALYILDQWLLTDERTTKTEKAKIIQKWNDKADRLKYALILAGSYGLLQGASMAGFVIFMLGESEEAWAFVFLACLSVTVINTWLMAPDIIRFFLFKEEADELEAQRKSARPALVDIFDADAAHTPENENLIKKRAKLICGTASFTLALVTAFGMFLTINSFAEWEDEKSLIGAGLIVPFCTAILTFAEYRLSIDRIEAFLKTGYRNENKEFVPTWNPWTLYERKKAETLAKYQFTNDAAQEDASKTYRNALIVSLVGMIGIGLVGTPHVSALLQLIVQSEKGDVEVNMTCNAVACLFLSVLALAQIPFYLDRAAGVVDAKYGEQKDQPHKVAGGTYYVYKTFQCFNSVFNAPSAYTGVIGALGMFFLLKDTKGESIEHNLFKFGPDLKNFSSDEISVVAAAIGIVCVYLVGSIFFGCAAKASYLANSATPEKLPDVYDKSNTISRMKVA